MTTLNGCFATFLHNIEPDEQARKHAMEAHKGVRDHLESDEEFGKFVENTFLYGSYARHTAVGDIKDVDIVVLTNFDPDNPDHSPKKVLAKLKSALARYYEDADTLTYQRKSVQVKEPLPDNPEVSLTLDVIPAVAHNGDDEPLVVPERGDGVWVASHPRGHLWFTTQMNDEEHGKGCFVPLVKMVKHWWAYNSGKKKAKPKGFWLEILTALCFDQTKDRYSTHFTALLQNISNRYLGYQWYQSPPELLDPAMPADTLKTSMTVEEFKHFIDTVNTSLPLAQKALEVDEVEASKIWNQLFGDEFPIIEDTATNHQIKAATFADTWYSPREQFLFRDFGIRNKLERYPISIDCDIEQKGFRRERLTENSFVKKDCSLTFHIHGLHTIPQPYTVMWKVKNTGQEAAGIGQLRGEVTRDQGRGKKHECSLYTGIHYVECYVINGANECIAKAKKYIRIP